MKIVFKKIKLHHFMSFADAEIELCDRGFCLVKGINLDPSDAAKSNGSGKSSIWNAISYVLTGETLSGLKGSSTANIAYNDGCWVSLEFEADEKSFVLTRSHDDSVLHTNLKIIVDGEDVGGKGIRESQTMLSQLLPDVTKELIGSVVLLGQGLPQKFTSNTPSGRKEVLEHLSKSDFMIEDIKRRISDRLDVLSNARNENDKTIASLKSKLSVYEESRAKVNSDIVRLEGMVDDETRLKTLEEDIENAKSLVKSLNDELKSSNDNLDSAIASLSTLSQDKSNALSKVMTQHSETQSELIGRKSSLDARASSLTHEIEHIEGIRDVCPTCGQKLVGVVKPSCDAQKNELAEIRQRIEEIEYDIADDNEGYADVLRRISEDFDKNIENAKGRVDSLKKETSALTNRTNSILQNEVSAKSNEYTKLKTELNTRKTRLEELRNELNGIETETSNLKKDIEVHEGKANELDERLSVVNKMSTFAKRDFRGYLLQNIIDYIDARAKNYCSKIFNTDDVSFELNGNDLDIVYRGKDYGNLSGGEKQRLDLVVQFAIRDMMSKQCGFSSNILVLDEITDALDSLSCDRVMSFIVNELSDVDSVFIVSHHSDELQIPADSEITIVKNENGISEVR